jgi:hypothetical protein
MKEEVQAVSKQAAVFSFSSNKSSAHEKRKRSHAILSNRKTDFYTMLLEAYMICGKRL